MAGARMTQVIRELRKKQPDGSYSPQSYLGAYLRFVDAVRGTNNRNLEEQLLLGCDCLMIEEETNDAYKTTIDFYDADNNNSPSNCYRLVSFVYKEESKVTGFDVSADGTLAIPGSTILGIENNTLMVDGAAEEFAIDEDGNLAINPGWITSREDILYYIGYDEYDIIKVASKVTQEMVVVTDAGVLQKRTKAVVTLA